jgi:hypothetical protein
MRIRVRWVLIVITALALRLTPAPAQNEESPQSDAGVAAATDVGIDAYRAHVRQLRQVIAVCRSAMSQSECASSLAGTDDNVAWKGGRRRVEYTWLRAALDDAAKAGTDATRLAQAKAALDVADQRLANELDRPPDDANVPSRLPQAQTEMRRVLATSEFGNLSEPSPCTGCYSDLSRGWNGS